MKKNLKLSFLLALCCHLPIGNCFSQAPEIESQWLIGTDKSDGTAGLIHKPGGGYWLPYGSNNIRIAHLNEDFSVDHYDIFSIKQVFNNLICLTPATDGGYLLGFSSFSNANAIKSENSCGTWDYWVIKVDIDGNIEWENTIGSTYVDELRSIVQTPDGGYLIGGQSESGAGFDKTEPSYGQSDYWVVKIDGAGNILWDNAYGGSGDDDLRNILAKSDGTYLLGGESSSDIGPDKSSNNIGDDALSEDYWIINIDAEGNILSDATFGGSGYEEFKQAIELPDGYLLFGNSVSGIGFDKSEANLGVYDLWLVRTDSDYNIIWENTIGSDDNDLAQELIINNAGNYILAAKTSSGISVDKSEINFGDHDYWVLSVAPDGHLIWENTIGGSMDDVIVQIIQTDDNGYVVVGHSNSGISADKTENPIGGTGLFDVWLFTLSPDDCVAFPEVCNSLDDNCNGLIDDGVTETINISAGGATTFCQGGNVLLTATYSGASVQWKKNGSNIPGATSLTYTATKSGNYSAVTTSACGNSTSSTISVTVNTNPNASITAGGATTFCTGGSVTLTETAVPGCSYQWYKGTTLIPGATSTNYIATIGGNYKCRVTKITSGCYTNSNAIPVSVPCKEGDELINDKKLFSIYPNPTNGTFILSAQSAKSAPACLGCEAAGRGENIQIYNSLGQLIYYEELISSTQTISLDNISSGIYFVRIGDGNNYAEQKLIIEK